MSTVMKDGCFFFWGHNIFMSFMIVSDSLLVAMFLCSLVTSSLKIIICAWCYFIWKRAGK